MRNAKKQKFRKYEMQKCRHSDSTQSVHIVYSKAEIHMIHIFTLNPALGSPESLLKPSSTL